VPVPFERLPRYLVLEPGSTVRFDLRPAPGASSLDVELENPRPGRSFLLLVGPSDGPTLQRMRLTGRARILFDARDRRPQVLMLANPQREPLVLQIRGRASAGSPRSSRVARPTWPAEDRLNRSASRPKVGTSPASTDPPRASLLRPPPEAGGLRRSRAKV